MRSRPAAGPGDSRRAAAGPRILTPHPGEFARLIGSDIATVQSQRAKLAAEFAATHGVIVLLKGQGTIITDGDRVAINRTGNPGMATGGSGDVLTGLIAALLAQGMPAFQAGAGRSTFARTGRRSRGGGTVAAGADRFGLAEILDSSVAAISRMRLRYLAASGISGLVASG